jgi:hypothetical protein
MKYKSKELNNYYHIGELILFKWVFFIGWIEGKFRRLNFKKNKPF